MSLIFNFDRLDQPIRHKTHPEPDHDLIMQDPPCTRPLFINPPILDIHNNYRDYKPHERHDQTPAKVKNLDQIIAEERQTHNEKCPNQPTTDELPILDLIMSIHQTFPVKFKMFYLFHDGKDVQWLENNLCKVKAPFLYQEIIIRMIWVIVKCN